VLEPWEEDHLRGTKKKRNPNKMNSQHINLIERGAANCGEEEEDEIAELQEIDKIK
jgi:hypothetical protein